MAGWCSIRWMMSTSRVYSSSAWSTWDTSRRRTKDERPRTGSLRPWSFVLRQFGKLQALFHQLRDIGRQPRNLDAHRLKRGNLLLSGALAARDDRAGVAHALAFGRGLPSDEADHRLGDALLDVARRVLLSGATDLADQH